MCRLDLVKHLYSFTSSSAGAALRHSVFTKSGPRADRRHSRSLRSMFCFAVSRGAGAAWRAWSWCPRGACWGGAGGGRACPGRPPYGGGWPPPWGRGRGPSGRRRLGRGLGGEGWRRSGGLEVGWAGWEEKPRGGDTLLMQTSCFPPTSGLGSSQLRSSWLFLQKIQSFSVKNFRHKKILHREDTESLDRSR